MAAYHGSINITSTAWVAAGALRVRFTSSYQKRHQVYAGRRLAGVTDSAGMREVICDLDPTTRPVWLQVVAVDDASIDYGQALPPRPYNVPLITLPANADIDRVVATIGSDTETLVGLLTSRTLAITPQPTGTATVSITPYDNRPPAGNAGASVNVDVVCESMPPDVAYDTSSRFNVSSDAGGLRIRTTMPSAL